MAYKILIKITREILERSSGCVADSSKRLNPNIEIYETELRSHCQYFSQGVFE